MQCNAGADPSVPDLTRLSLPDVAYIQLFSDVTDFTDVQMSHDAWPLVGIASGLSDWYATCASHEEQLSNLIGPADCSHRNCNHKVFFKPVLILIENH